MKNTIVTAYENLPSKKAGIDVNLVDWLKDESHKSLILHLRTIDNKIEYDRIKKMLPCAMMSGTFITRHNDGLKQHSGYICIDIDGKDNPQITDYEKLRDNLKNILNVSYAALSAGGKGVFCLIPIQNPNLHKEHFLALEKCFEYLGIKVDASCKNVARLRIMSYDPNAYLNENPLIFHETAEENKRNRKPKESREKFQGHTFEKKSERKNYDADITKKKVIDIIDKIKASKKDITGVYADWFKLACSLYSEFKNDGRKLFHEISKFSSQYKPHECDELYDNVEKGTYTQIEIGSFFHYAKKHGFMK